MGANKQKFQKRAFLTKFSVALAVDLLLVLANEVVPTYFNKVLVIDSIHSISIRFRQSNSPMTKSEESTSKHTGGHLTQNFTTIWDALSNLVTIISVPHCIHYLLSDETYLINSISICWEARVMSRKLKVDCV